MTKIEWTDETWNVATGCTKVSPGCDNCYMFREYPRLKAMGVRGYQHAPDVVRVHKDRVHIPRRWRKPRRVFVNSMSDFFHRDIPDEWRDGMFRTMRDTPRHTYQILTKRPRDGARWWFGRRERGEWDEQWVDRFEHSQGIDESERWPANVWLGVSIESQEYLWRLNALSWCSAPVKWVSAEPLLGPLDFWAADPIAGPVAASWIVVGGESGPNARPMDLDWVRSIRDQCADFDVPFFLKQLGGVRNKRGGDAALLDGRLHHQFPNPMDAADIWAVAP